MNEMNYHDVERSFKNSYIFLREGGRAHPFWIDNVSARNSMSSVRLHGHRLERAEANKIGEEVVENTDPRIDLEYPDLGNWRDENSFFYTFRKYERQYTRGIRKSFLGVLRMREDGDSRGVPHFNNTTMFKFLYEIRNGIKKEGVVDRDYCIVGRVLFFRGIPVGVVDKDSKTIKTPHNLPPLNSSEYKYDVVIVKQKEGEK